MTKHLSREYLIDVLERVLATFLIAFVGVYLPAILGDYRQIADLSVLQKAAVAGGFAVLTLVKTLAATFFGDPNSASLMPRWLYDFLMTVFKKDPAPAQMTEDGTHVVTELPEPDTPEQ